MGIEEHTSKAVPQRTSIQTWSANSFRQRRPRHFAEDASLPPYSRSTCTLGAEQLEAADLTMAWRPTEYLIEGELDNTQRGRVAGWMRYAGLEYRVTLELDGEFHRDIRGAKIHFYGDADAISDGEQAKSYMHSFAPRQTGKVGDITAGRPPQDYVDYPYIEWYSDENGRVVLELEPEQLAIIGTPIPVCESDPISEDEQENNMVEFLHGLRESLCTRTNENRRRRRSTYDPGYPDDTSPRNGGGQQ